MTTFARAVLVVSCFAVAAFAEGCRSCTDHQRTYMLGDAELARVTEGTGSTTAAGCDVVCDDLWLGRDAGDVDGGLRASVGRVVSCTLSGRQLTCDYGVICAV
jgi:hypothetical protein